MTLASTSKRLTAVDSLRGLAALSVVLFHYTYNFDVKYGHSSPVPSWPYGYFGVQLFFAVSGFVIFMTVDRSERLRDFVVSRFARLYPVYWVCVTTTWVVVLLIGPSDRRVGVSTYLANLTMFQSFVGFRLVDGVYWTLRVELTFYLAIGIAFWLGWLRGKRLTALIIFWLTLSLALRLSSGSLPHGADLTVVTDALYAHLFVAGMCFYLAQSQGWSRLRLLGVLQAVPFAFLGGWIEGVVTIGLLGLLWLAIADKLPVLRWAPLVWLGGISYALYLIHQNLGYGSLRLMELHGMPPKAAIFICIVGAIAVAAFLTHRVERPLAQKIKGWLKSQPATVLVGPSTERDSFPYSDRLDVLPEPRVARTPSERPSTST